MEIPQTIKNKLPYDLPISLVGDISKGNEINYRNQTSEEMSTFLCSFTALFTIAKISFNMCLNLNEWIKKSHI